MYCIYIKPFAFSRAIEISKRKKLENEKRTMASSDALLPISAREEDPLLSDGSRSDPNAETHGRRRPVKGLLAVTFGLFFIAFYVALIATHDGSRSNDVKFESDGTATTASRARLAGVSEKSNDQLWKLSGDRNTVAFSWNNSMLSWQRTGFHFQPGQNWMNGTLKLKLFFLSDFIYLLI